MAVAYGGKVPAIQPGNPSNTGTGTSAVSQSWTISGSNSVILFGVRLENHATVTVSSVSWSLGSDTAVEVGTRRLSDCYTSVWAIPAPTTGSGTVTANFSVSVAWDFNADYFTGAHQTTPCPISDTTTASATGSGSALQLTLTPTNVGANDAEWCSCGSALAGSVTSVTPTQTYLWNSGTGYRIGTGSLLANASGASGQQFTGVGVRIQEVAAGVPIGALVVGGTVTVLARRILMPDEL